MCMAAIETGLGNQAKYQIPEAAQFSSFPGTEGKEEYKIVLQPLRFIHLKANNTLSTIPTINENEPS